MTDPATGALLPEGLHDTLAPKAEFEASVVADLMRSFAGQGYEAISPPLMEFEETLLAGVGASEGARMFRLMDPGSGRMLGLRTDMTTQVARVATTRLAALPRPLRLCYAGQVVRVKSGQLRSEREFGQAGIELIGTASSSAEAEVLLLAVEALRKAGANDISVDLTVPPLVPLVAKGLGLNESDATDVRRALDEKDIASLAALDGDAGRVFDALLRAAGRADRAMEILGELSLPGEAGDLVGELGALVATLTREAPDLAVTIDPGEFRGFEYHSGICFSVFSRETRGELGRGGRYAVDRGTATEPAVGFSIYVDSLMRALPKPARAKRLFLPSGTPRSTGQSFRDQGWRTVQGLDSVGDERAEAKRLECSHIFTGDKAEEI